jgi:D-serine dehydratase
MAFMNLSPALDTVLDHTVKGVPPAAGKTRLADIGSRGWSLLKGNLPLPAAVIERDALHHNSQWMRRFVDLARVSFSPHGKTTMAPQLFDLQLKDGAWAITVATVHQLKVCRAFGVGRVLMANQLTGRLEIETVLDELAADPAFEFYCLIDSLEGVTALREAAARRNIGRPIQLLLEGGTMGGRTGARTIDQAIGVARAVRDAGPLLALRGVEGFEGLIAGATPQEQDAKVAAFIDFLVAIARACAEENLFAPGPVILTAGGSAFFDLAATRLHNELGGRETQVVIRSGCYLTHDSKSYRELVERLMERMPAARGLGEGLKPALFVWAYVQSRPEPGRVIANLGKRDIGFDVTLPVVDRWYRAGMHSTPQPAGTLPGEHKVVGLNDQHAHIEVPAASPLQVGDRLCFGVSHPCTTFDRWQLIYEVDAAMNVVGAIRTYF